MHSVKRIGQFVARILPDRAFLKLKYRYLFGRELNLLNPQTYNEKLQWLKLYDRKPLYTQLVDKAAVKEYVALIIGREHLIPTIGVWDRFEDIDFDTMPEQFVLKCTHDSGSVVICTDKSAFDKKSAGKKLNRALKSNFYKEGREWAYKSVPRKIIAEQYLSSGTDLKDYKFWCFNGVVKCIMVCSGRFSEQGLHITFYDTKWEKMNVRKVSQPVAEYLDEKPIFYDKMVEAAELLSQNIPFLRVDFYEDDKNYYFGELTIYAGAGFDRFEPDVWDSTFGEWLKLPPRKE